MDGRDSGAGGVAAAGGAGVGAGAGGVAAAAGGVAAASTRFSGPLIPHPARATQATSESAATRRVVAYRAPLRSRTIGVDGSTHPHVDRSRMSEDATFLAAADAALAAIGAALDRALDASDADLDWSLVDGILEIACEDGSKVIVNRHAPNRELWVAARSGGFHFRAADGRWRDSRSGRELGAALAAILRDQAAIEVSLDLRS